MFELNPIQHCMALLQLARKLLLLIMIIKFLFIQQ